MPDERLPALRASSKLSRRQLFRSVAIAAGGAALLAGSATPAFALMPQKAAAYQDKPKGKQMCSNCTNFRPPSSCGIVAGTISPNGWCRFYTQKS